MQIIDFARQAEEFPALSARLGGSGANHGGQSRLLALNASRPVHSDDYYDEATRDVVREIYAGDFALLAAAVGQPAL